MLKFVLGFMVCWSLLAILDLLPSEIDRLMNRCGYDPHPISDVAWELYERGLVPVGTAWYYTVMLKSANGEAGDCMRNELEPGWKNR